MPMANPQAVASKLTSSALFLVVTIQPGRGNDTTVQNLLAELSGLVRAVGFRDPGANLSCVGCLGSRAPANYTLFARSKECTGPSLPRRPALPYPLRSQGSLL